MGLVIHGACEARASRESGHMLSFRQGLQADMVERPREADLNAAFYLPSA